MTLQKPVMPESIQHTPIIRETPCKTVLGKSGIGDYSMNCYGGCAHSCAYCYARFMQRFHPHTEPWGEYVDVKTNAVEALERQLCRARAQLPPGDVFVSSACDAWQPIERDRRLTRECCRLLVQHGFQVNALTKSDLILRDFDIFSRSSAQIGVTVTTLDPRVASLWEPYASRVEDRFHVLEEARTAKLKTSIMFGPLLPFISDNDEDVYALLERAAALDVDTIWVDAFNPRPKVWESTSALLDSHFPGLRERYRQVLFAAPSRTAYLAALHDRIARAADRLHIADRVSTCV